MLYLIVVKYISLPPPPDLDFLASTSVKQVVNTRYELVDRINNWVRVPDSTILV